jgi:small multidrug resistance pump
MEMSVAYAVWSGLGTALVTIIGLLLFGESATALKFTGILLIIAGLIALNITQAA